MVNVWKSWAESKGLTDEIVEYEAKELDEIRKIETTFTEPFHVVCLQWLELFFAKDCLFFFSLTASWVYAAMLSF